MTAPHTQNQAEDRINFKAIGVVAVIALSLFALGVVWADAIRERVQGPIAPFPVPENLNAIEHGIVDMHIFDMDMRAEELRAAKLEKLSSYGWVDPEQNLVHVPIEVAMQRYVETAKAPPAPVAPPSPVTEPGEVPPGDQPGGEENGEQSPEGAPAPEGGSEQQ